MTNLIRWRSVPNVIPWRPFGRFWDWDTEDFFEDFMEPIRREIENAHGAPRVESYQKNGNYVIKADLPGVDVKNVHVTVEDGYLTIDGERKRSEEIEEGAMMHGEVCYGSFKCSMAIPEGVKADQIKAKYHDGVLEITAPVEEHYLPKKIEVEVLKS